MASLTERFSGKEPLTYEVTVPVVGGQFVVWDGTATVSTVTGAVPKVKVATAHATNWLGMAKYDATPGAEFGVSSTAYYSVPVNAPVPHVVACPHFGVYEVVNAGNATLNPGDPVEIVTADGKPGSSTAAGGFAAMAGGLAVVGYSVSKGPVAPGALFRLRLGRA